MADDSATSTVAPGCCQSTTLYFVAFLCAIVAFLYLTEFGEKLRSTFRKAIAAKLHHSSAKHHHHDFDDHKKRLFAPMEQDARGKADGLKLLEIGAGAGANFRYYPPGTSIICVEPNDHCEAHLRKNFAEMGDKLKLEEFKVTGAEDLSGVTSGSIDAVVSTHVFCNVTDVDQCLREIIRVLKPGGKFYFLEHIIEDKNSPLYNRQQIFAKFVWFVMKSRINLDAAAYIDKAGFSRVDKEVFSTSRPEESVPRIFRPFVCLTSRNLLGTATK